MIPSFVFLNEHPFQLRGNNHFLINEILMMYLFFDSDCNVFFQQAQFNEISLAAYTDQGVIIDVQADRSGTRVVK